jgi:vancomycin resistance protein YoaR
VRRRSARSSAVRQRAVVFSFAVTAAAVVVGFVFAGSPARLADGVRIAGVDVGGLTVAEARSLLERRAAALAGIPVTFTAGEQHWRILPRTLSVEADWAAAVDAARRQGEGFGPVRGLRRMKVRVFGSEIAPPTQVYEPALQYQLRRLADRIDRPHREAALVLRGLEPVIVPGRVGLRFDRAEGAAVVVHALAGLSRRQVPLPVGIDPPLVTAADLRPAADQTSRAVSAPVELALGPTRWRLNRYRVAALLALPRNGADALRIGGPGAREWFDRFARRVNRPAVNADWIVASSGQVAGVPARNGRAVDERTTRRALLAAVLSPSRRFARVSVVAVQPERTTAEAQAMNITGRVGGYETIYGGDANRIHNVRLVSRLIDKTLIAPGEEYSFNRTTGERTADKGFLEAPVIINGELQTGLGGGVCQVSTTVFNAAYEAGLKITARANHALYISHYPTGRDATVNYPDLDLRFVNDTGGWLLLRTFVGGSSLYVGLYGTPVDRRVETVTAPLRVTGPAPIRRISDPSLAAGHVIVEESGQPARATSVRRRVYDADGDLLHEDVWYSSYRAEKKVVRIGAKPEPKPEKPEPKKPQKPEKPIEPPPPPPLGGPSPRPLP